MSENSSHHKSRRLGWRQNTLRSLAYVGWVIVIFIAAQFVTFGLFWLLLKAGIPFFDSMKPAVINTLEAFVSYALALVVTLKLPWQLWRDSTTKKELGLSRLPDWADIGLAPIAFIPYFIISAILVSLASTIPGFQADQVQDVGFSNLTNSTGMLLAFITLVVLAPFIEETLFRGYLYGKLRRYNGMIISMLITSLCFGLLHFQLNVGLDVFALSLTMCILREVTRSIWAGVLLHMIKNAIAYYLLFVAPVMIH